MFAPATGTPFLYDYVEKIHERINGQVRLSWAPIRYPAVPVPIATGSATAIGLWAIRGYPASVTAGIDEPARPHLVAAVGAVCGTNTRCVLAGYSQGSDVVNFYLRGKILTRSSRCLRLDAVPSSARLK